MDHCVIKTYSAILWYCVHFYIHPIHLNLLNQSINQLVSIGKLKALSHPQIQSNFAQIHDIIA